MSDQQIVVTSNKENYPNKTNKIKTSKYSLITFLPKNLYVQFSKLANIYFLIIGIMQMITTISITDGKPVIFGPLTIVIGVSMLKDAFEDYKRHKSDQAENENEIYYVSQSGVNQPKQCQEIMLGQIVCVNLNQNAQIPADLILIQSSDPKGICYIETKNLDGETNLKIKQVPEKLRLQKLPDLPKLEMQLTFEGPNSYLYQFNGNYQLPSDQHPQPLSEKNILLRGSILRNTTEIYGICIYNGHETKIMKNSVNSRPKKSTLEILMNWFIILIFIIQMVSCSTAAFFYYAWENNHINELSYLEMDKIPLNHYHFMAKYFIKVGNWILIFTNFVPISLLVTLEMVKLFQAVLMTQDKQTSGQGIELNVQSSNLNEELGQIQYIFSDKTGTLTKNLMDFKCFTVDGKSYGFGSNSSAIQGQLSQRQSQRNNEKSFSNIDFFDYQGELQKDIKKQQIQDFLLSLAICHTIQVEQKGGNLLYIAQSPDEMAFVNFAASQGIVFQGIDEQNFMNVKINNQNQKFKLLHVFEFSSASKRMSVVVEKDNQKWLYTKGADSFIQPLLAKNDKMKTTYDHINQFSQIGLRTLIFARKNISSEYAKWSADYLMASAQINARDDAMETSQNQIVKDLTLLGGSAIEDKLQDNVGQTISNLKQAGIQVWVLTGDKIETAINIGISCKLLNELQIQYIVQKTQDKELRDEITRNIQDCSDPNKASKLKALIISGDSLITIMNELSLSKLLVDLADKCEVVLACRVSPKQKSEIVQLIRREKPKVVTLAIGDGANDVNMITAAHVGIGIKGVEGQQAARSSDYSIGEFQILERLLFFHGRECYRRNSNLVLFNFYKNMLLVLPQFWWGMAFDYFSSLCLYDALIYQCYNLFYTSMPIVIYAIFDEEYDQNDAEKLQQYKSKEFLLYADGPNHAYFNVLKFIEWLSIGALQAFYGIICYLVLEEAQITRDGFMGSLFATGSIVITMSVMNGNFKVLQNLSILQILIFSNGISYGVIFFLFGSIFLYILSYVLISAFMTSAVIYNSFSLYFGHPLFYLITFLIFSSVLFDFGWERFAKYRKNMMIAGKQKMHSAEMQANSLQNSLRQAPITSNQKQR